MKHQLLLSHNDHCYDITVSDRQVLKVIRICESGMQRIVRFESLPTVLQEKILNELNDEP